jgi:putative FmdB family regulatory protein
MPIYEYECNHCGHKFELLRRINDSDAEIKCPECGADYPKRLVSMFGSSASKNACSITAPT